jgi:broad specificity phosphatase PhoE
MLIYLVRHGHGAHVGKRLPTPESPLSKTGQAEAASLIGRFDGIPLTAIYSSPYGRCVDTITPLAKARRLRVTRAHGLRDIDYGDVGGKQLRSLRAGDVWRTLATWPTSVRFPNGESILECHARVITAFSDITDRHGPDDAILVASHGDPIRFIVAHHLGVHPDIYRRLSIDPVSVSVLQIVPGWVQVRRVNETGGLGDLVPPPKPSKTRKGSR